MTTPRFILSKKRLLEQLKTLKNLGLKISYSYKTNNIVGNLLQELDETIDFSIHSKEEIRKIKNKKKIWFFAQAETSKVFEAYLKKGITNFVIDNEIDLKNLLNAVKKNNKKITLSLRMKTYEHRVGSGKYFVYGMPSEKINQLIQELKNNPKILKLGIHIHRKSQNISEWDLKNEIVDSLDKKTFDAIDFINIGGGLPVQYKNFSGEKLDYIFEKIKNFKKFLDKLSIETHIEPGRFLAAPCIKLKTKIIQIQDKNIILNTTIYNCALDTLLTNTRMLIKNELNDNEEGSFYLIKGNSPTRDDIFRYRVKLKNPKIGDEIIFLNAGAYNYTTDFFGYKKLPTEIVD